MGFIVDRETGRLRRPSPEEDQHNRRYSVGRLLWSWRADEVGELLYRIAKLRRGKNYLRQWESVRSGWTQRLRQDVFELLRGILSDYDDREVERDREIEALVSATRRATFYADYPSARANLRRLERMLRQRGWALEESASICLGTQEDIPDGCDSIEEALRYVNEAYEAREREKGERDATD